MNPLDELAKLNPICRMINSERTKDFPTPHFLWSTGELIGFLESDDHFRKRIEKELERK